MTPKQTQIKHFRKRQENKCRTASLAISLEAPMQYWTPAKIVYNFVSAINTDREREGVSKSPTYCRTNLLLYDNVTVYFWRDVVRCPENNWRGLQADVVHYIYPCSHSKKSIDLPIPDAKDCGFSLLLNLWDKKVEISWQTEDGRRKISSVQCVNCIRFVTWRPWEQQENSRFNDRKSTHVLTGETGDELSSVFPS